MIGGNLIVNSSFEKVANAATQGQYGNPTSFNDHYNDPAGAADGTYDCQIVTSNSNQGYGFQAGVGIKAGIKVVGSLWVRAPVGMTIQIWAAGLGLTYPGTPSSYGSGIFTPPPANFAIASLISQVGSVVGTGAWQWVTTTPWTMNNQGDDWIPQLVVFPNGATTFYIDAVQIEVGLAASPYARAGSERVTPINAGGFSFSDGTSLTIDVDHTYPLLGMGGSFQQIQAELVSPTDSVLLGPGGIARIIQIDGTDGMPDVKDQDVDRMDTHGAFPGVDLVQKRKIMMDLAVVGDDSTLTKLSDLQIDYENKLDRLRSIFAPSSSDMYLYVRKPGATTDRMMRVRTKRRSIVTDEASAWTNGKMSVELDAAVPYLFGSTLNYFQATLPAPRITTDASVAPSAQVINSATGAFTAADVGKRYVVPPNIFPQQYGRIVAVNSPTQIQVDQIASGIGGTVTNQTLIVGPSALQIGVHSVGLYNFFPIIAISGAVLPKFTATALGTVFGIGLGHYPNGIPTVGQWPVSSQQIPTTGAGYGGTKALYLGGPAMAVVSGQMLDTLHKATYQQGTNTSTGLVTQGLTFNGSVTLQGSQPIYFSSLWPDFTPQKDLWLSLDFWGPIPTTAVTMQVWYRDVYL